MNRIFRTILLIIGLFGGIIGQVQEPQKIYELEEFGCEEVKLRTFYLLAGINETKGTKGYILYYEGRYRKFTKSSNWTEFVYASPRVGEVQSRIGLIKKYLNFLKYEPSDVLFVNGGFRDHLTIEYWLVPPGVASPKPTPTLTRIRFVKGKPPKPSMGDC